MIDFFESYPSGNINGVFPPQWNFIKTGYLANVAKVQEFHHLYPTAVNASHFLVSLLQSIAVPMDVPLSKYYRYVEAKAQNLAMALGMTSSISKGKTHDGIFYGPGCPEILLSLDIYTDPDETYKNWENVSAVYPIWHPKSDMGLFFPTGETSSWENGLAVIAINIPQLAVQYRAFVEAQKDNLSGESKSVQQFVGGYVLPNMLPAQTDLALYNRIEKAARGERDGLNTPRFKHSFTMPYYEAHLDVAIGHILDNVSTGAKEFDRILKIIPAFYQKDMMAVMVMPDVTPTSQVDWALCASRLPVIDFLIDRCEGYAAIKNQSILNQIVRVYRNNNTGAMIHSQLPHKVSTLMDDYMARIKEV